MADLLALIPSGPITLIGGLIAALLGVWKLYAAGKSAGSNAEIAKRNDAYERHLQEIADASDARSRIHPSDSVSNDPNRRD